MVSFLSFHNDIFAEKPAQKYFKNKQLLVEQLQKSRFRIYGLIFNNVLIIYALHRPGMCISTALLHIGRFGPIDLFICP